MKRFLILAAALLLAIPVVAQELPFTIGCMADKDKPLEVTFCDHIFAAAVTHEFIRESTQDDYSSLMLWVVVVQGGDDQYIAAAVQLNLSARSFGGAELALNTSCYFVPVDEVALYAAVVIGRAHKNAPKDLSIFAPATPSEFLQLEASPP